MMKLLTRGLLLLISTLAVAQAVTFNCNFVTAGPNAESTDHYTCIPIVEAIDTPALESVIGTHLDANSDEDVEYLNINLQTMPFVPTGIDRFFPNLKFLRISGTELPSISAVDLRQFPQLVLLNVIGNAITTLESDLFSFNPDLQWIAITRCQIRRVGTNLLDHLADLTYVDFRENPCINVVAQNRDEVLGLIPSIAGQCPMDCTCKPKGSKALRSKKRVILSVRR